MPSRQWSLIVAEAALIADSYSTPVTLRQLHYRLVAAGIGGYVNDQACYKRLSSLTAEARRNGTFPALSDRTRGVERRLSFKDPASAISSVISWYRRNRTENQTFQVWVLYEKATLGAQIEDWVNQYGLPTAALRGYSSESLEREVFEAMEADGRDAVVFYVGDLDPEGEDIERNFVDQAGRWGVSFKHWERLTVRPEQIGPYGLVPNPGKTTSSRAAGFVRKYGRLFQIETEAVAPDVLEGLVRGAITNTAWFDESLWTTSKSQERKDIKRLREIAKTA
jgi:hypothetical protein